MGIAYFDCFAGAAGDMIVAALLDAGADFDRLRGHLEGLGLPGCRVRAERATRRGIAGTRFVVEADEPDPPHRHLADVVGVIDRADLPARAGERAQAVFKRLAAAEANVHGVGIDQVHFHEVGAADSLIDIVGACVALELAGVEAVACSPLPLGRGTVRCAHGTIPVPAPATVELLRGFPVVQTAIEQELTTPTAAALLTELAGTFGPPPPMVLSAVGYGAGSRDQGPLPNLLRVMIGEPAEVGTADSVVELSANLDDCTGEIIGATIEKLLAAGALDAWAAPIVMKKSRPAWMLSVLCRPRDADEAEQILFRETTTFGVRRRACSRGKLERSHETVETPYGPVRIKVGRRAGTVACASPEFEDCAAAAEAHDVSIRRVMEAAADAWRESRS